MSSFNFLPLFHSTDRKHLTSLLTAGTINPTDCKVFGDSILYLFYGYPSYFHHDVRKFEKYGFGPEMISPSTFMIDIDKVKIESIYSTDTGFLIKKMLKDSKSFKIGNQKSELEDFILNFWITNAKYNQVELPKLEPPKYKEIFEYFNVLFEKINESYVKPTGFEADTRIFKSEILSKNNIDLSNTLLILPHDDIENIILAESLSARNGMSIQTYWYPNGENPQGRLARLKAKIDYLIGVPGGI